MRTCKCPASSISSSHREGARRLEAPLTAGGLEAEQRGRGRGQLQKVGLGSAGGGDRLCPGGSAPLKSTGFPPPHMGGKREAPPVCSATKGERRFGPRGAPWGAAIGSGHVRARGPGPARAETVEARGHAWTWPRGRGCSLGPMRAAGPQRARRGHLCCHSDLEPTCESNFTSKRASAVPAEVTVADSYTRFERLGSALGRGCYHVICVSSALTSF